MSPFAPSHHHHIWCINLLQSHFIHSHYIFESIPCRVTRVLKTNGKDNLITQQIQACLAQVSTSLFQHNPAVNRDDKLGNNQGLHLYGGWDWDWDCKIQTMVFSPSKSIRFLLSTSPYSMSPHHLTTFTVTSPPHLINWLLPISPFQLSHHTSLSPFCLLHLTVSSTFLYCTLLSPYHITSLSLHHMIVSIPNIPFSTVSSACHFLHWLFLILLFPSIFKTSLYT